MFRCTAATSAITARTVSSRNGSVLLARSPSTHGLCRHPLSTTLTTTATAPSSPLLSHRRHYYYYYCYSSTGSSGSTGSGSNSGYIRHIHRHHPVSHHHRFHRDISVNGDNGSSGSRGASLSHVQRRPKSELVQQQQRSKSELVEAYDRVLERIKEVDEALVSHAEQHPISGPINAATVSPSVRQELAELQMERVKLLQEQRMLIPDHIRQVLANDDIPREVVTIKLLDEEGKFLGDMTRSEALERAKEAHLDIILINAKARPPLCRLGSFRQHIREELRKHEEAEEKRKRLEREMKPKEVRFKPRTGKRDVEMKIARAKEFLDSGKRVKLSVVSRNVDAAKTMLSEIMDTITQEDSTIVVDQQDQAGANMISTIIRRKK